MRQVWVMEDFDYEDQCWVIVSMGIDEDLVSSKGHESCGVGYDSQLDTRVRQIWVD